MEMAHFYHHDWTRERHCGDALSFTLLRMRGELPDSYMVADPG
jgi:hypothetical protein